MKFNYEIYQIANIAETKYAFRGLSEGHKPRLSDYKIVYNGEVEGTSEIYILESLFRIYNINHPKDFKGHSLSTSDVVKLDDSYYYCDNIGWSKIDF